MLASDRLAANIWQSVQPAWVPTTHVLHACLAAQALQVITRPLPRPAPQVHKSIVHDDVDVRGFFAWSLLDNFEWGYGFTKKFGLHHVDMATLERTPKASAHWFAKVVQRNRLELGPKRSASAAPLGRLSVHSEV